MNDEEKEEIMLALKMLQKALVNTGTSMALDSKNRKILFFDTDVYLKTKKMKGFSVDIDDLVKRGGAGFHYDN